MKDKPIILCKAGICREYSRKELEEMLCCGLTLAEMGYEPPEPETPPEDVLVNEEGLWDWDGLLTSQRKN